MLLGIVGAIADGTTSSLVASGARWKSLVSVGMLMGVPKGEGYCSACFDGNYPVPCRESGKLRLECGGCCGSR